MKSFNKIGVVIALLFGIILLLVSAKENTTYEINPAITTIEESYQVMPCDINEWIIEKNQDYMLIDIREEKKFDRGSIPTAENIFIDELFKKEIVSDLPEDRPIIIIGNIESNTIKIWSVLKTAGLNVFVLKGGYNYWLASPSLPKNMSDEDRLLYMKNLAVANSLKGIESKNIAVSGTKPVKKKKYKKKKRKKKNKLEGC